MLQQKDFGVDDNYRFSRDELVGRIVNRTGLDEKKVRRNLVDVVSVGILLKLPNRKGQVLVMGYDGSSALVPKSWKLSDIIATYPRSPHEKMSSHVQLQG